MPADAALSGGVLEALHRRLLAGESATSVLRALFGDPVSITRLGGDDPGMPGALRREAAGSAAVHRRVRLSAGGRPVSSADLWYLPERLGPGMREVLARTDTPFGDVVAPLRPYRETLVARICAAGEAHALEHEAVLRAASGVAIAAVRECYAWPAAA